MGCFMQADNSVTIKACKGFISNLIPIQTERGKGFVLLSSAHYLLKQYVLFIAMFQIICFLCCNILDIALLVSNIFVG